MSATLFYFSGTGNSLFVARAIAGGLEGARVVAIPDALKRMPREVEGIVGIVYPVYAFGMPLAVKEFLEKVTFKEGAYCFCVATYGGIPGDPMRQAATLVRQAGGELGAGFLVHMPGNSITLHDTIPEPRQRELFLHAEEKVRRILSIVRSRKHSRPERRLFFLRWLCNAVYSMALKKIPVADAGFYATNLCTQCGLCAKICTGGNITLDGKKPRWHHHCQLCLACLHWCPSQAIELGRRTAGRKRYHHPGVRVEEMYR